MKLRDDFLSALSDNLIRIIFAGLDTFPEIIVQDTGIDGKIVFLHRKWAVSRTQGERGGRE